MNPNAFLNASFLRRKSSFKEDFLEETQISKRPWFQALENTSKAIRRMTDGASADMLATVRLPPWTESRSQPPPDNIRRYLNLVHAKRVIDSLKHTNKLLNEERNEMEPHQSTAKQEGTGMGTASGSTGPKSWRLVISNRLKHTVSFLEQLVHFAVDRYDTALEEYKEFREKQMENQDDSNQTHTSASEQQIEDQRTYEEREKDKFVWPWAYILAVLRWCALKSVQGEWKSYRQTHLLEERYFFAGELVKTHIYGPAKIVGFRWDLSEPRYVLRLKFGILYVPMARSREVIVGRKESMSSAGSKRKLEQQESPQKTRRKEEDFTVEVSTDQGHIRFEIEVDFVD